MTTKRRTRLRWWERLGIFSESRFPETRRRSAERLAWGFAHHTATDVIPDAGFHSYRSQAGEHQGSSTVLDRITDYGDCGASLPHSPEDYVSNREVIVMRTPQKTTHDRSVRGAVLKIALMTFDGDRGARFCRAGACH